MCGNVYTYHMKNEKQCVEMFTPNHMKNEKQCVEMFTPNI